MRSRISGRHASALVGDDEPDRAGLGVEAGGRYVDSLLRVGQGLAGVLDEVDDYLLEALEMGAHRGQALLELDVEPPGRLLDVIGKEGEGGLDDEVERDLLGLGTASRRGRSL